MGGSEKEWYDCFGSYNRKKSNKVINNDILKLQLRVYLFKNKQKH